jgi:elongation factor P
VTLNFVEDDLLFVSLPPKITLKVTAAPPGERGNTADSATKQVTLETGLKINCPLFIEKDDNVIVNTDEGTYVERAKG